MPIIPTTSQRKYEKIFNIVKIRQIFAAAASILLTITIVAGISARVQSSSLTTTVPNLPLLNKAQSWLGRSLFQDRLDADVRRQGTAFAPNLDQEYGFTAKNLKNRRWDFAGRFYESIQYLADESGKPFEDPRHAVGRLGRRPAGFFRGRCSGGHKQ